MSKILKKIKRYTGKEIRNEKYSGLALANYNEGNITWVRKID